MKYLPEWKGRLLVDGHGNVFWDGVKKGQIVSRRRDGARSPRGMLTNTAYHVVGTPDHRLHFSMTSAISSLVDAQV